MKTIATLLLSTALASSALAGSPSTYSGKSGKGVQPVAQAPDPACFGPGFSLGLFGGGMFPQHGNGDDTAGGGVLAEYFFNENFGFQTSYGLYATSSEHHQIDGSFILRAPISGICVAPYLMAGGGLGTNATTNGDYHAGAGIEARLGGPSGMGLFADGAYHFASHSDGDFIVARMGVKFRF